MMSPSSDYRRYGMLDVHQGLSKPAAIIELREGESRERRGQREKSRTIFIRRGGGKGAKEGVKS